MTTHRPFTFAKKKGDLEWLAAKACPKCKAKGRLLMGLHVKEIVRCLNCGQRFRMKGRPIKEKKGA